MNIILFTPSDIVSPGVVRLTGRVYRHMVEVLKSKSGDILTVGEINGRIGSGAILQLGQNEVLLNIVLENPPPTKIPVILCVALSRPAMLKRILLSATAMGVSDIAFFHSCRVEKSFWQSTVLHTEEIFTHLQSGLEQAKDTVFPQVSFHKRFKPFVEGFLPGLLKSRIGLVADPSGDLNGFGHKNSSVVLIVGPEGGFIPFELKKLKEAGCRVVTMGPRILRVDTAVVALLAKLF